MIGIALLTVAIMLAVAIDVYGWRTGLLVWAASTSVGVLAGLAVLL